MGYALGGGSGWVLLTYMPRDGRLINQYAAEHSQAVAGGIPILALDMYEHAYHIDFGANAKAYVDTFLRNVDWQAVEGRYEDATQGRAAAAAGAAGVRRRARRRRRGSEGDADAGKPVQLIDARPRHFVSRQQDIADGVTWRDPERLQRVDGRAVEVGAGGRVLRLRLPRRLPAPRSRCARPASTRST